MNHFYVYTWCFTNDVVFYVGKGKDNRAYEHLASKSISLPSLVIKAMLTDNKQLKLKIVKKNLEEQEAFNLELKLIKYYSTTNLLTNHAYNEAPFNYELFTKVYTDNLSLAEIYALKPLLEEYTEEILIDKQVNKNFDIDVFKKVIIKHNAKFKTSLANTFNYPMIMDRNNQLIGKSIRTCTNLAANIANRYSDGMQLKVVMYTDMKHETIYNTSYHKARILKLKLLDIILHNTNFKLNIYNNVGVLYEEICIDGEEELTYHQMEMFE